MMNADHRLRIGLVSVWFERGQAYVTKMIRDSIADQCQTFVFARTGVVYDRQILETRGYWEVPNLTTHPDYQIPPEVLHNWVQDNRLDLVIFNEEYDFRLCQAVKQAGARAVTYLDYYTDDWSPAMGLYDLVLCSNLRTYNLVKDLCRAHYMGWAVDSDLFRPGPAHEAGYTFFHNAGWLGIQYRKMTPACLLAFDAISRHLPQATLLVHAQAGLDKLPPQAVKIIEHNARITYRVETLPAPGLYHLGRIMVFPTKLEGLGLPLFEALACGLPVIATDAPPMNEFIKPDYNGLLVPISMQVTRSDHIAYPEEIINLNRLALAMAQLAADPDRVTRMSRNARQYAKSELRVSRLGASVMEALGGLMNRPRATAPQPGDLP